MTEHVGRVVALIECARCHGDGGWYVRTGADGDAYIWECCDLCKSTGNVPVSATSEPADAEEVHGR